MRALEYLQLLNLDWKKQLLPKCFSYTILKAEYTDDTVKGLAHCIQDYFKFNRWKAAPIINKFQFDPKNGHLVNACKRPQQATILGCLPKLNDRYLYIEIFVTKGLLPEPGEVLNQREAGGNWHYFVAKDFQGFYEWIEGIRLKGGYNA